MEINYQTLLSKLAGYHRPRSLFDLERTAYYNFARLFYVEPNPIKRFFSFGFTSAKSRPLKKEEIVEILLKKSIASSLEEAIAQTEAIIERRRLDTNYGCLEFGKFKTENGQKHYYLEHHDRR